MSFRPTTVHVLYAASHLGGGWFYLAQIFLPAPLDKRVYTVYTVHIVYVQNIGSR